MMNTAAAAADGVADSHPRLGLDESRWDGESRDGYHRIKRSQK